MQTLREIGERDLITRITTMLPVDSRVVVGPGDDCAVVRGADHADTDWVLTCDPVVTGVHFSPEDTPTDIGHKAVGRVLSDIAAMGASPAWGLVDLVAPPTTTVDTVESLYRGITALASRHGFLIVGGDVAEGQNLELHVFGIGEVPRGAAVLRGGAKPGDLLFVTGALGGSRMGRHLCFEPRINEGVWLRDWASAMIDVSDGLAGDLRHMTDMGGTGCDLNMAAIPISPAAHSMGDGHPPLDHALHDGEDFELLFTIPEARMETFKHAWASAHNTPCSHIGVMSDRKDLIRCLFPDGEFVALERGGYTHFR